MSKKKHPVSCDVGIPLAAIKIKSQNVIAYLQKSGDWSVFKDFQFVGTVESEKGEWIANGVSFQRVRDAVSYVALS